MADKSDDNPELTPLDKAKKTALNLFEKEELRAARKGKGKPDAEEESSMFSHLGDDDAGVGSGACSGA